MKPVPVIIPSKFPKIVSNFIPLSDQIPKLPFVRPFVPFSLPSLSFSLVHRSPFSHPNAIFLCMRRQLQRGENSFKRAIHFHENLPFSALCGEETRKNIRTNTSMQSTITPTPTPTISRNVPDIMVRVAAAAAD